MSTTARSDGTPRKQRTVAVLRRIADHDRFGPLLLALAFGLLSWLVVVASVESALNGGFASGTFGTSPAMLLASIVVTATVTPLMLGKTTRNTPRIGGITTLTVAWAIAVTTHAMLVVVVEAVLHGDREALALDALVFNVLASFLMGPYLALGAFAALALGVAVWAAVLAPAGTRIRSAATVLVLAVAPVFVGMQITGVLSSIS